MKNVKNNNNKGIWNYIFNSSIIDHATIRQTDQEEEKHLKEAVNWHDIKASYDTICSDVTKIWQIKIWKANNWKVWHIVYVCIFISFYFLRAAF